jgi:hypothetical protein
VQVNLDLEAAEMELAEIDLNLGLSRMPCGNEVMDFTRRLEEAHERLKAMESKKASASEMKATKDEIAAFEAYFRELKEKAALLNLEQAPIKMNELRRKIIDLRTERDLLTYETRKLQFKKVP